MANLSNIDTWLTKCCGNNRSRRPYERTIRNFSVFAEKYGLSIETLRDSYRTAKYENEREKDKFLDKIHDVVEAYGCELKTHNYASKHQAFCLSVVRSYMVKGCQMRDVEIVLPKQVFVTYHNRDLKKEDVRKILENATLRDRVFFLMMAESGMRPQTMVQLTYGNIKEDYEANRTPMKIELPSLILKDNPQARFSFIGPDGFRALREYLSNRGELKGDDPLFLPSRPGSMTKEKLGMEPFSNSFSRLATKLGLAVKGRGKAKPRPVRMYGLRKYFNNNMRTDRSYIEFWMGHVDISHSYISNDVEKHRERYAEGYPSLRIYESIYEAAETLAKHDDEIRNLKTQVAELTKSIEIMQDHFLTDSTVIAPRTTYEFGKPHVDPTDGKRRLRINKFQKTKKDKK